MAISVTSRPNTWSAVKNPLIYKFATTGGPFTNYRIEVEVFKASDDSSLTGGVKFSFSPDADDVTYADVSTMIKAYLKAEWIEPATLNEVEADTSLEFYIKYQELYDGSAASPVDDVANPRFAVFGALQIPSAVGNDLDAYVPEDNTKKFLTVFDRPKLWRGYPSTLSFIYPVVSALNMAVIRAQYDESGTLIVSEWADAMGPDDPGAVQRLDLMNGFTLDDDAKSFKVRLQAAISISDSDTGVTGLTTIDLALGETFPAGSYRFIAFGIMTGTLTSPSINIYAYDGSSTQLIKTGGAITTVSVSQAPVTVAFDFDQIRITFNHSGGTPYDYSAGAGVYVDYTEELTFDVEDPCDNPLLLFWKNSLGGDTWWMFEHGQDAGYQIAGNKKAKRMTLFGEQLTLGQWEALNEIHTTGEVSNENITELTGTVNKTSVRDQAQVYVIDEDGNKTGVIAIPTPSVISTRDVAHSIEIEIEYPELA